MVPAALLVRLLLAAACAASAASAPTTPMAAQAEAAKAAHVTDIVPRVYFKLRVTIKFPGAAHALADGQLVAPSATAEEPSVMLEGAEKDKLYALLLVDPDAPDPAAPTYRSFLHWLVVDIPGDKGEASSGHTLVHYKKASPPVGTHRYIALVYQQRAHSTETEIRKETPPERNDFSVTDWAKVTRLGDAISMAFFLSDKAFEGQSDL